MKLLPKFRGQNFTKGVASYCGPLLRRLMPEKTKRYFSGTHTPGENERSVVQNTGNDTNVSATTTILLRSILQFERPKIEQLCFKCLQFHPILHLSLFVQSILPDASKVRSKQMASWCSTSR